MKLHQEWQRLDFGYVRTTVKRKISHSEKSPDQSLEHPHKGTVEGIFWDFFCSGQTVL